MSDFGVYQGRLVRDRQQEKDRALAAFAALPASYDASSIPATAADSKRLIAIPVEQPWEIFAAPDRPASITVVSTDGSQIYPDRNIEPTCFLLNISEIAFQYGTLEAPHMTARPHVRFRGQDLEDLEGFEISVSGQEVVSALRDELELAALLHAARTNQRRHRPVLAIADGTLIRWMLSGMRNPTLEQKLLGRYTRHMEGFEEAQIPLCSYISMPGNNEFINLLMLQDPSPMTEDTPDTFSHISDRRLFKEVLNPGDRTAIFKSQSRVLEKYPARHKICYFYVHVEAGLGESEIARVEFPFWMIDIPGFIDLVHATVVSECRKGNGYPVVLAEAHEQAVVRGADRRFFYELIKEEMAAAGQVAEASLKSWSKETQSQL